MTSVRFSPNGKFVLAWTLDSSIRLWNYVEGRCVKTYQGHANTKFSLSGGFGTFAAAQKAFVVSGSEDGEVLWWDVQSKEVLQREGGHEGVVLGVDSWGGALVVSGGLDRTVRVWGLEDAEGEGEAEGEGVGEDEGDDDEGEDERNEFGGVEEEKDGIL